MFDLNPVFNLNNVEFLESETDLLASNTFYYFSAPKEWLRVTCYKWPSVKETRLTLSHPGLFPEIINVKCTLSPVVEIEDGSTTILGEYDVYLSPHHINALINKSNTIGALEKYEAALSYGRSSLYENSLEGYETRRNLPRLCKKQPW